MLLSSLIKYIQFNSEYHHCLCNCVLTVQYIRIKQTHNRVCKVVLKINSHLNIMFIAECVKCTWCFYTKLIKIQIIIAF